MSSASSAAGAPGPVPDEQRPPILEALRDAAVAPFRLVFGYFGERAMMLGSATRAIFQRPFRLRLFLDQMHFVAVGCIPIIMLASVICYRAIADDELPPRPRLRRRASAPQEPQPLAV